MALNGFTKACASHTPGINRLILVESDNITAATVATGYVTSLDVTTGTAKEYVVDRYGLKATFEASTDDSGLKFCTQKIEAHISKLTSELRLELKEIADASACGLCAVLVDSNGNKWVYGLNVLSTAIITQASSTQTGLGVESITFDSGLKLDEEGTDKATLILSGLFSELPFPTNGTISTSGTGLIS